MLLKEFIKSFDDFKLFANYLRKIFDYVVSFLLCDGGVGSNVPKL